LKNFFKNILDAIWPTLEPLENTPPPIVAEVEVEDENLETSLALVKEISGSEEDRRKTIESKASLFLGTISVASSIVVAASAWITGSQPITVTTRWSLVGAVILAIYAARTVWFSIRALKRGSYHLLNYNQVNVKGDKNTYHRQLIKTMQQNTVNNYAVINEKVDYLVMAQSYYKAAIVIICLYAVMIFSFSFIDKKPIAANNTGSKNVQVNNFYRCDTTLANTPKPGKRLLKDTLRKK